MGLNMEDSMVLEQLTDMASSLAGINATLKSMEKRIDTIDERVQRLEQKPSQYIGYIVSALISTAIALLITLI